MVGLNAISYGQPLLDEKVNFFVEYFEYCKEVIGAIHTLELESPLSLVEKILFQLQHNKKRQIVTYLENHFTKLNVFDKPYLNQFNGFAAIAQQIAQFNNLPKNQRHAWLTINKSLVAKDFKTFKNELEKKMFKLSINSIIGYLKSSDSLQQVKPQIKFHTSILAAELIFNRVEKKEVSKLFNQTFSSDARTFPYPHYVASKGKERKEKYFKNRYKRFETPFLAIQHFLNKSDNLNYVIFKIDNLVFPDDYEFVFDNVTFCSTSHTKMKHLAAFLDRHPGSNLKNTFNKFPYTVCIVPVKNTVRALAYRQAIRKIETSLLYFNSTLNKACAIDRFNYMFSDHLVEFGFNVSVRPSKESLTPLDVSKLTDNVYHYFNDKTFAAKGRFLDFESKFIEARKTDDLASLWDYLENLTGVHPKKETQVEWMKQLVAGALLKDEKRHTESIVQEYLKNAIHPFNCSHKRLGITPKEQDLYISNSFNLKKSNPKVNSEFFSDTLRSMRSNYTKPRYKQIHDYYLSILTEAYEQRNLVTHSGVQQPKATVKLLYTFNSIVTRFRWAIFDYMEKHPTLSLHVIFEKMEKDYKKVLSP